MKKTNNKKTTIRKKPPLARLILDIHTIGRNKGLKWSNGGLNKLLAEISRFRISIGGRRAQFYAKLRYARK